MCHYFDTYSFPIVPIASVFTLKEYVNKSGFLTKNFWMVRTDRDYIVEQEKSFLDNMKLHMP